MWKWLVTFLFVMFLVPSGLSLSVGAVPGYIDFGTAEPGETLTGTIYLSTEKETPVEVTAEFRGSYQSHQFESSDIPASEVSEESIEDWVTFPEDGVVVDGEDTFTTTLPNGEITNANAAFDFYIEIPQDAEPGYHVGTIRPKPELDDERGYGAQIMGVAQIQFQFRVAGDARRSVQIDSVRAYRTETDQAVIDTVVRNTGTVTTSLRQSDFAVVDRIGDREQNIRIGARKIAPGERELIRSVWQSDALEGGDYEFRGELDYRTGMISVSESFSLSDTIQAIPNSEDVTGEGEEPVPLWLIIMALALLGVLMYAFEIKPVYIFGTVGFLGASAIIIVFPISNLLIALPLIMVGVLVYYV